MISGKEIFQKWLAFNFASNAVKIMLSESEQMIRNCTYSLVSTRPTIQWTFDSLLPRLRVHLNQTHETKEYLRLMRRRYQGPGLLVEHASPDKASWRISHPILVTLTTAKFRSSLRQRTKQSRDYSRGIPMSPMPDTTRCRLYIFHNTRDLHLGGPWHPLCPQSLRALRNNN